MATQNFSPINQLCEGFLQFRMARLNTLDFQQEHEALNSSPIKLLQQNLMFLALNHRMTACADCSSLCSASNCSYSSVLTVTAQDILQHWQKPKYKALQPILTWLRLH